MKKIFIFLIILIFILTINYSLQTRASDKIRVFYHLNYDSNHFSFHDLGYDNINIDTNLSINNSLQDYPIIINYNHKKTIKFKPDSFILSFGYIKHHELDIEMSSHTIHFFNDYQLDIPDFIHEYNLSYQKLNQEVKGFFIEGEVYQDRKWQISLLCQFLKGIELSYSSMKGKGQQKDYQYLANANLVNYSSRISQQQRIRDIDFRSNGYSLGYSLQYRLDDKHHLRLRGSNVLNCIYWYDVFTNYSKLNTDNVTVKDGIDRYISSVSGKYSFNNYVTHLTPEYNLSINGQNNTMGFSYKDKLVPYFMFCLYQNKILGEELVLNAGISGKLYKVQLQFSGIKLDYGTENFKLGKSKKINLELGINFNF